MRARRLVPWLALVSLALPSAALAQSGPIRTTDRSSQPVACATKKACHVTVSAAPRTQEAGQGTTLTVTVTKGGVALRGASVLVTPVAATASTVALPVVHPWLTTSQAGQATFTYTLNTPGSVTFTASVGASSGTRTAAWVYRYKLTVEQADTSIEVGSLGEVYGLLSGGPDISGVTIAFTPGAGLRVTPGSGVTGSNGVVGVALGASYDPGVTTGVTATAVVNGKTLTASGPPTEVVPANSYPGQGCEGARPTTPRAMVPTFSCAIRLPGIRLGAGALPDSCCP